MAVMEISTEFEVDHQKMTTVGPCPGCESWQVDYDVDHLLETVSLNEFYEMLESALREHYEECVHLRKLHPGL